MATEANHTLLMTILSLNTAVLKALNGRLSVHGLGASDYRVLQALAAAPDQALRRIDLAERVGLSASGVTRLLNPLEKIGLVDKQASDHDARVSLVSLSRAGQRMLEESAVTVTDLADQLFMPLGASQRPQLEALLARLAPPR